MAGKLQAEESSRESLITHLRNLQQEVDVLHFYSNFQASSDIVANSLFSDTSPTEAVLLNEKIHRIQEEELC